jgi:hypothetical protein
MWHESLVRGSVSSSQGSRQASTISANAISTFPHLQCLQAIILLVYACLMLRVSSESVEREEVIPCSEALVQRSGMSELTSHLSMEVSMEQANQIPGKGKSPDREVREG